MASFDFAQDAIPSLSRDGDTGFTIAFLTTVSEDA